MIERKKESKRGSGGSVENKRWTGVRSRKHIMEHKGERERWTNRERHERRENRKDNYHSFKSKNLAFFS